MSSTGETEPGSAEDQAYFRAIEERFLALRGRATLLSAEDWQVARGWRRLGVPLELVLRTLEELFARQRERRSKRGISSLRYFRAAIEAAFEERLELAAGGSRAVVDAGPPPAERLARLAAAIPVGIPGGGAVAAEVAGLGGSVEAVELRLVQIEARWLEQLEGSLDPARRNELAARVDRALGAARIALPADELAAARGRLLRQALRERFQLPLLSLFSPVALANGLEPEARP